MFKRLSIALTFLLAGLVAGIVLTGRMRDSEVATAQPSGPSAEATAEAQRPAPPTVATTGPDFTRVAEQTVRAVANISAVNLVRRPSSPFFNDPFFQQFFGDPNGMYGSRDRYASSLGSGVVVSADGYVVTNNHVLG
jgi:S1-C subfamily serine protease